MPAVVVRSSSVGKTVVRRVEGEGDVGVRRQPGHDAGAGGVQLEVGGRAVEEDDVLVLDPDLLRERGA
jgi:hypothetical protein